jgi:meso-butanediol dehydrogenase/(S,S)-butanediol dehydrogenase/diacetyl reductase
LIQLEVSVERESKLNDNKNRFEGRRALITGGGSGIGRATAIRLAAEGAAVFLVDVNEAGSRETVEQIRSAGGTADWGLCDVRSSSDCQKAVQAALSSLGGLDVLCNIAGVLHYSLSSDCRDEDWDRVIGVNLTGTFFMCRAALPHLLQTQSAIVNLASAAGLQAVPYAAAYCASKGGVVMLTKSLAIEHAKTGPRVNCICPGGVATPLIANFELPEGADASLFSHISSRMPTIGQPEDIAAMVAYLASDEARFITAAALTIDGGQTA